MTTELNVEEQIIQIMDQLNDMKLGRRFQIQCPWCQQFNQRGAGLAAVDEWKRAESPWCCDFFEIVIRELSGQETE